MADAKEIALRKIFYLVTTDIPSKYVVAIHEYVKSLSDEEVACAIDIAQKLYDRKTIRGASWKVSKNAIKLCLKIAKNDIHVFPFIEKIATRGWDTAGGTYCFSMPILTKDSVNNHVYSNEESSFLASNKTNIIVEYNESKRQTEVKSQ